MNRGYLYGDGFFETIAAKHGKLLFFERHYLRLASTLRVLKMDIPKDFTMETLASELKHVLDQNNLTETDVRIRMSIHRSGRGRYTPDTNKMEYTIECSPLNHPLYKIPNGPYEVDLYQTHTTPTNNILYNLKTNNRILNVLASLYAEEKNIQNVILINQNKHAVEGINGNLFVVKDQKILTPPLSEGCIKGVFRSMLTDFIEKHTDLEIEEQPIPVSQLQGADELFITNVISGIQPVTTFRRKNYTNEVSSYLFNKINNSLQHEAF